MNKIQIGVVMGGRRDFYDLSTQLMAQRVK